MSVNIAALYERFFSLGGPPPGGKPWHYRRRCTSMRLPACELLAELARQRTPRRVLDLGSGLTSHVLRALIPEVPGMVVVTTDTSPRWLTRTVEELERDHLNTAFCVEQSVFEANPGAPFDLISVDIGDTSYRLTLAEKLTAWLAPKGILFLDDGHIEPAASEMRNRLANLGFRIEVREDTTDEFGGYAVLAHRD